MSDVPGVGLRPINRDLLQDFRCPFQADITVESVCFVLMPQQNSNDWIEQVGAGPFREWTFPEKTPVRKRILVYQVQEGSSRIGGACMAGRTNIVTRNTHG